MDTNVKGEIKGEVEENDGFFARKISMVKEQGDEEEEEEEIEYSMWNNIRIKKSDENNYRKYERFLSIRSEEMKDRLFYEHQVVKMKIHTGMKPRNDPKRTNNLRFIDSRDIGGHILLTKKRREIEEWVDRNIHEKSIVAIDTEFDCLKPVDSDSFVYPLFPDVIQIVTDENQGLCLQTNEGFVRPPQNFVNFLANPRIVKVFCSVFGDYVMLRNWVYRWGFRELDEPFFPKDYAERGMCRIKRKKDELKETFNMNEIDPNMKGLSKLCEEYLRRRMKKDLSVTISRWSSSQLDDFQFDYAMTDPLVTLRVYQNKGDRNEMEEQNRRKEETRLRRRLRNRRKRRKKRMELEEALGIDEENDPDGIIRECDDNFTVYRPPKVNQK